MGVMSRLSLPSSRYSFALSVVTQGIHDFSTEIIYLSSQLTYLVDQLPGDPWTEPPTGRQSISGPGTAKSGHTTH